ncbi:MAG: hypothetical protein Q9191_004255 [Dirinaria sp. TL-2023a]
MEDDAVEQFRQAESQQESSPQAAIAQNSAYHSELGNAAEFNVQQPKTIHISLQELAKNFQPFTPPPTPAPMDPKTPAERSAQPAAQKKYTTTLTIFESTYPNGHRTYRARTSPIMEESVQKQASDISKPSTVRQPFLNRLRERHRQLEQRQEKGTRKEVWRTLSVKRQRKLKMKKHKYRKYLRRTRTLRRRLDRA